jgi:hypothetical protein
MESLTDVALFPGPVSTGRQGSLRIDQPGWKTVCFISNLNTFQSVQSGCLEPTYFVIVSF